MTQKIAVGVIGAGAMGSGIAQVAANSGHKVVLLDAEANALNRAKDGIEKNFNKLVEKGKLDAESAKEKIATINFTSKVADFSSCGLIIEAVVENLEVKKRLFSDIESVVADDCILASNTSSLPVVAIASSCKKTSRVIGIHFFNPAFLMPLVEIVPALTTDIKVVEQSRSIIDSWGKTTVIAKDTPGFIVNRIARPYYGEAIKMYEEGLADFATIDWAMREFGGFKMGPFELMDFIGNDINFKVTETVWEQFFYDPRYKPSLTQKRLYEAGLFGRKTGRGYYDYSNGNSFPEPDKNEQKGKYIFNRILCMLINEAAEARFLNIATAEDIDLAMTRGVNYPKGLLKWADETGVEPVLKQLNTLFEDYGDDRYRPSLLLKKMSAEKNRFFQDINGKSNL